MHCFESALLVSAEDIEIILSGHVPAPWADYVLNPRRLRGSDFLMRWSQGQWSEDRLTQAVTATGSFFALPYGPSGAAPDDDVRAFELYFERLEAAGLGQMKRPDLLVFRRADESTIAQLVTDVGGIEELPFTSEDDKRMRQLLGRAVIAAECENSLWVAKQMPDYGKPLKPQKRLGGLSGVKKSAVLPTVIIKDEDRAALARWQSNSRVPIHVWHVFYDVAYGLALDRAEELIMSGEVEPTDQVFQAPGGATTRKRIYKFPYQHAYPLGDIAGEVQLVADKIVDKNGHILPYVRFSGGQLTLRAEALDVLDWQAGGGPVIEAGEPRAQADAHSEGPPDAD